MKKYSKLLILFILLMFVCSPDVLAKNNYIANITSKSKIQVSSGDAWVGDFYNSNADITIVNNTGFRLKVTNVDFNAQKTYLISFNMYSNSRIQNIKETRVLNLNGQLANCTISDFYQGSNVIYPSFAFYCTQYYNELIFEFYGKNVLSGNPFHNNGVDFSQVISENDNSDITNRLDVTIKQNQEIINGNKDLNDNLNKVNENLTSEERPSLEELDNLAGYLPPGPVDAILNIPLSILQSLLNILNSQCSPITIKLPFVDNSIILPCMYNYLSNMTGFTVFMDWASKIAGTIILIRYLINLYGWVDNQLTLRENTWNDQDQWGGI